MISFTEEDTCFYLCVLLFAFNSILEANKERFVDYK